jgi:hypothetical protein
MMDAADNAQKKIRSQGRDFVGDTSNLRPALARRPGLIGALIMVERLRINNGNRYGM